MSCAGNAPVEMDRVFLKCDACKGRIGKGGIRMLQDQRRNSISSMRQDIYSKAASDRSSEKLDGWIQPEFGVEVICDYCTHNYKICSDCGSGKNSL